MGSWGEGGEGIPVSEVLVPCFAWWEFRSRSAFWAIARGSWPSYSADMVLMMCILVVS